MPSSSQSVLPVTTTASTATNGDHKPYKPLLDARAAFEAYLLEHKAPGHFLSVDSPDGPTRRQDVNGILSSKQLVFVQKHYRWHNSKGRWTTKNGGQIVTEPEIYDAILSHQRVIASLANDAVYEYMKTRFEGVHSRDVRKAHALWQQHNLANLDRGDDVLWGGPAATLVTREKPLNTPDDSDSDSSFDSASASADEGNTAIGLNIPHRYTFHPHKPHTLLVGTSRNDGKDAWLSLTERPNQPRKYRLKFFNHRSILHTEDQLKVDWFDEFKYSKFAESDKDAHYQRRMQRQHLHGIIQEHEAQVKGQGGPSRQASNTGAARSPRRGVAEGTSGAASTAGASLNATSNKRRRDSRRKSPAVESHESSDSSDDDVPIKAAKQPRRATVPAGPVATTTSESSNEVEVLSIRPRRPEPTDETQSTTTANVFSPSEIAATTLLVSASDQPTQDPVCVPFRKCPTHKKFFETLNTLFEELITLWNLQGKATSGFNKVLVRYAWNQKSQVMRRGNNDDWEYFLRNLEKAWKKESKLFEVDGCEIGLLLHVNR